jgi:DEAD/DEAH box helicase domain-containing protein
LDQFYSRNPGAIFDSPFSSLTLDLDNPIVLESHLQCAADELPVSAIDDLEFFGNQLPKICEDKLSKDEEGWYHCHPRLQPYPAKSVPIRAAEDENYSIIGTSFSLSFRMNLLIPRPLHNFE